MLREATSRALADIAGYGANGVFVPLDDERDASDLPVRGAIPPELDGMYLRNSFNSHPLRRTHQPHAFLEDGMVHGVRIARGRALWYRNRWITTDGMAQVANRAQPGGPVDRRWSFGNAANIGVVAHAGRLLALGETGLPYELSGQLETVGRCDFSGALTRSMTAHPKHDPATGALHAFGYWPRRPYVTYFRIDPDGQIARIEPIDVAGATVMHDFAISARFAVFIDQPLLFERPPRPGGGLPFHWAPEYGSRLGLLDLHREGTPVRWFPIDTGFVSHVLNAFDEGGQVVLRAVVSHPYYLTDMPRPRSASLAMREWRIDTVTGRVSSACIAEVPGEFPKLDERLTGRAHRYGYSTEILLRHGWLACGGLFKYDFATGSVEHRRFSDHQAASEAQFVPAGEGSAEDEGWVMCFVYDAHIDRSRLVVLDAQRFAGPEVASIELPQRVPYGAHGTWVARQALERATSPCR